MTNLWVFGDSFAYIPTTGNTWLRQIAARLNCELRCYARGGSSLEYTYEQFNNVRSQFEDSDIVIVALTDVSRRWAIRANEHESMLVAMQRYPHLEEAVKLYITYLDNDSIQEAYLTNFLHNVEHITLHKNLNTVIIPCFESSSSIVAKVKPKLITAYGNLFAISQGEFMPTFTNRHSITQVSDLRANHLIASNHTILAEKVVRAVTNKQPINLCEDFQHNVLCAERLRNVKFSEQELFDIHLNEQEWNLHSF
jgi:hypothetical protein